MLDLECQTIADIILTEELGEATQEFIDKLERTVRFFDKEIVSWRIIRALLFCTPPDHVFIFSNISEDIWSGKSRPAWNIFEVIVDGNTITVQVDKKLSSRERRTWTKRIISDAHIPNNEDFSVEIKFEYSKPTKE